MMLPKPERPALHQLPAQPTARALTGYRSPKVPKVEAPRAPKPPNPAPGNPAPPYPDADTVIKLEPEQSFPSTTASTTPEMKLRYDFFLSHYQATGGDQVMTLELRLSHMGFVCWLDQKASILLLRNT